MTVNGTDVSVWQGGNVDYKALKAQGAGFVIIRAGYGSAIDYPSQYDGMFEVNYSRASEAGMDIGAYWYSYAGSVEAARREAQSCIKAIRGKRFSYPIFFDLEELSQLRKGKDFCDSIVTAFCTELESAGYYPGLYCSTYWLTNCVSENVRSRYPLWVAEYGVDKCGYKGEVGIWQYGTERCASASGGVIDADICYVDYPAVIKEKGLNGYDKPEKKSLDEIAREVIQGKWSAGAERKKLLTEAGYDYDAVQARVNEILGITKPKKSLDEIAKEVIQGKWSAGAERKRLLTAAGYDYDAVQARVNEMLGIR